MTREEAKAILAAWRPGLPVTDDPVLAEAFALAAQDPELNAWLAEHSAAQTFSRDALRSIPVPPDLADRILAEARVARPAFARQWLLWAAAAAVVVLAGALILWSPPETENTFATFRSRMVRAVIREYRMDVATNDLAAIRGFMARNRAPADFELTSGLALLPPVGGGLLGWRGERVAMVCLDGGRVGTAFLFVVPRNLVREGAPAELLIEPVSRLATASWSRKDQTYVFATSGSLEDLRGLLSEGRLP